MGLNHMSASRLAVFVVSSLTSGLVSQTASAQGQPADVPQELAADAQTLAPPAAQTSQAPQDANAAPAPEKQEAPAPVAPAPAPAPSQSPRPEPTFVGGFGVEGSHKLPKASRLGIGATLGFTSGLGLSLRRHFSSGLGLQFGGFGIYTEDVRHLNLATQVLYTFYTGRWTRVYALGGVAWHANQEERGVEAPVQPGQDPDESGPVRYEKYFSHSIYFGPGIGGELYLHRRFAMSLDVPLVFSVKQLGEDNVAPLEDRLSIHPGVNASFHFYF